MRTLPKHLLNLLRHPGQLFLSPFYRYLEKRYIKIEKFEIKFLLVDLALLFAALGIAGTVIGWFIQHRQIENQIFFESQIAPTEIVSGAPSTLVIRYTNGTGQELKNVYLDLTYPKHFLLQELAVGEILSENKTIAVGNLAPDAVGSVKIRGVMFGDVGGEQIFESKMSFNYGEKNQRGEKISRHVFFPSRSVLELGLEIPEKIVAGQPFAGAIVYKNTGALVLPEVKIKPNWPENFEPITQISDGWTVPAVEPGDEGRVEFSGTPAAGAEGLILSFSPSFVFGVDEYQQDTLTQEIAVVLPQLKISHSVETTSATPGGTLKILVQYENTGNELIYDVKITADSHSPFAYESKTVPIGSILGQGAGQTELELKLKPTVAQSQTINYEHLTIDTAVSAVYKIENTELAQAITVFDTAVLVPLTTPITLRSFGRYATERGDQLGRGPLPPTVGEETKYWIFWNLSGTTNEIKNLFISGQLPDNVSFTGRQTVSIGSAVSYNPETRTIIWSVDEVSPTFSPLAKIIGAAFEVAIIPTNDQLGTTPTLISDISLSGTDGWTNAWLTASGSSITTDLPGDLMAGGLGTVVD
jgi:hypothetical protein